MRKLIPCESLRNNQLRYSAHVQLSAVSIPHGRSSTDSHAINQVIDLGRWRLVSLSSLIIVQTALTDLNQSQGFINIFRHDLFAEPESSQSLGQTQNTE